MRGFSYKEDEVYDCSRFCGFRVESHITLIDINDLLDHSYTSGVIAGYLVLYLHVHVHVTLMAIYCQVME